MTSLTINPAVLQFGAPALALGFAAGALIVWLILRHHHTLLEAKIKNQDAVRHERDIAIEAAKTQLTSTFADLANQSLQSNSENFLRLAEQNLGTQHEKAKRELGDREKAIENLVKPIRDALQSSQKQINELEKSRSEAYGGGSSHNSKRCS